MSAISDAFNELMFGEVGSIFGLLLIIVLAVAIVVKFKQLGLTVYPVLFLTMFLYFDNLAANPNLAINIIALCFVMIFLSAYMFGRGKD